MIEPSPEFRMSSLSFLSQVEEDIVGGLGHAAKDFQPGKGLEFPIG